MQDSCLLYYLRLLAQIEGIRLEPSALAGFEGLHLAISGKLGGVKEAGAHLVWGTGGGLVPEMDWALLLQAAGLGGMAESRMYALA